MTSREAFLETWKMESATTQRVLDAVPNAKLDYRPDPKSRTGLELAAHVAGHGPILTALVETGRIGGGPMPAPKSLKEAVGVFGASLPKLEKLIQGTDDKTWDTRMSGIFGPDGKAMMQAPLGTMVWFLFYDLVHHRGQLCAYLRAMGGKVPSVYGPSADDPGRPS